MSKENTNKVRVFFPYYINQSRLLDIYAILNGGYSEYAEVTSSISSQKTNKAATDAEISGGFKILNLGARASNENGETDGYNKESTEMKVQTITSILSLVKSTLERNGYLCDLLRAEPGSFVCLPVNLQINSIKALIKELVDFLKLFGSMKKAGVNINLTFQDVKKFEEILKSIQIMFAGEEIIYETEDFAVIGNIIDENLYQSARADLINTEMTCLAQVKRVFPEGTELMRNTMFTKIKDAAAKEGLVSLVRGIVDKNIFDFESTAVISIHNKPVYQLEIIALYQ